jgi:hypothetical protein
VDACLEAGVDAGEPESCADVNACVASGTTAGPIDIGAYDSCPDDPNECQRGPCAATGTQSQWLKVQYLDSCPTEPLLLWLTSPSAAPFDLDVYEVPPSDAGTSCPKLTASAKATVPGAGAQPAAYLNLSNTGMVYLHIVAEAGAKCTTGQMWSLSLAR